MNESVIQILEELESTSGSLAKRDALETNVSNELLKRVFVATYDAYTTYYVNKFRMPAGSDDDEGGDDDALEAFLALLDKLAARELTGNDAKHAVELTLSSMTDVQQKWCQRIILRNLRVGVQESSINKVWPKALRTFGVSLAETLKTEFVKGTGIRILEPVKYPVRVEPKLDGLRCIAFKKDGVVAMFTRNGTPIDTLPRIKQALEAASYDNVVLDGEMLAHDWNESASIMMAKKSKHDDSNMVYNVFDALPLEDWVSQCTAIPYYERVKLVSKVAIMGGSVVKQVPHITANNEAELLAYFQECLDNAFEGVMLKSMRTAYRFKRSDNILKMKPVATFEGVIVGHYEGRRGTRHEGLFGGFNVVLMSGEVTRVGGGFSDALKADIQLNGPDTFVGKIVEIEAQPDAMTKDGLTRDGRARFPVFCRFRDLSDVDPKVIAAGVAWFEKDEGAE